MPRATDGCGKTDDPRPVDKRKFDVGYLRAFGLPCPDCKTTGVLPDKPGIRTRWTCTTCDGLGFVSKDRPKRMKKDEIPE